MSKWASQSEVRSQLGYFRVIITPPGGRTTDVTFFRNVPVEIMSMSYADPFGDSTAQINFPQISILDDIGQGDLHWLKDFSNVDIKLVKPDNSTQIVWEGFIASHEYTGAEDSTTLSIQCQGALFQLDKFVQAPSYPRRPIPYEVQISSAMDPLFRPSLRTKPLLIEFPAGWDTKAPAQEEIPSLYDPVGVVAGQNITGYFSRSTGSWERTLTGYIQNLLQTMFTNDLGDQWTIRMRTGRQPVLQVRRANAPVTYTMWAGMPGVGVQLTRDYTMYANVLYGEGTDPTGRQWKRQVISNDGTSTDYEPLAYLESVYPDHIQNSSRTGMIMRSESFSRYESGLTEALAIESAEQTLRRYSDPGFAGTLSLTIDPPEGSRYLMRAGQTILLKGFAGSGETGIKFHIAEVNIDVQGGTVSLKVDSKFRDLITMEEAINRNRDALTPVKLLQINKRSVLIEDAQAPWDYTAGSGYFPRQSVGFFRDMPPGEIFPYADQAKRYPPRLYPKFYLQVNANAAGARNSQGGRVARWTMPFPILMASKGTIRRTEVVAYDKDGNVAQVPFHLAVYQTTVYPDDMPDDGRGPSPFLPGAFDSTDIFGNSLPGDDNGFLLGPQQSLIIGWGDGDQPAGYSPGLRSAGDPLTGLLTDDQTWTFDLTNNLDFDKALAAGRKQMDSGLVIYGALYAEWHDYVFFRGRFYNQEAGT